MPRVDIPLIDQHPVNNKELPHCSWCGSVSTTVCGRCKTRAYCSTECQKHDWKAGHQTACTQTPTRLPQVVEKRFELYHIPYVARWAINVRRWGVQRESREFEYLLSRLPDEAKEFVTGRKRWPAMKMALARELVVRRLAEIMTQGQWEKTKWKHDKRTERDYLVDRTEYVWTGQKYVNGNLRFPNFNLSMCECGEFLFLASHPAALTGIYAAAPLKQDPTPDPAEEFAAQLAHARKEAGWKEGAQNAQSFPISADGDSNVAPADNAETVLIKEVRPDESGNVLIEEVRPGDDIATESGILMFGNNELMSICDAEIREGRQSRFRQAFVGKMAYCRTIGIKRARRWDEIVLEQCPVGVEWDGGELPSEPVELLSNSKGSRRHHLCIGGVRQKRWRSEVHGFKGYCIVVNRGPADEAVDFDGEFSGTMAARFTDIDVYDKMLEHPEPPFIDVPILQLLPEDWHSDYVRACGKGEKGEQVRINR